MRISTPQMNYNGAEGIRLHSESLYNIQQKISSGQRVMTPGDDPVASARIYVVDKSIKQMDQFNTNGAYAADKLRLEDSMLTNFTDVMQRVRELTVYGMNDTQNVAGRQAIAAELRGLLENMKNIANTQDSNGEFMFAGDKTDTPAFQQVTASNVTQLTTGLKAPQPTNYFTVGTGAAISVTRIDGVTVNPVVNANQIIDNFNGKVYTLNPVTQGYEDAAGQPVFAYSGSHSGSRFVQISPDDDNKDPGNDNGDSSRIRVADQGVKTFGLYNKTSATPWQPTYSASKNPQLNYNVFDTVRELANQFDTGTAGTGAVAGNTKLDDLLAEIDANMKNMGTVQSDVGTRLQRIDMQNSMNQDFQLGLTNNLSQLRDQDMVSGINEYQKNLTGLQVAQQSFAKMSQLSLFDYIK